MEKINPKCLDKKALAYTATGYMLPYCWCDNPVGWVEPQIKRLRQEHLKVNNNSNIEDIITSTEWLNFFEELKTNPSNTCKRFCSVPLNQHINKVNEHAPR